MDAFRQLWQSGYEGQHIEELISGVFSDFAPYAGAEYQRLTLVRQYGTSAATTATVEDSGDMAFSVGHTAAGSTMFTTTGLVRIDANLKVPLPLPLSGQRADSPPPPERRDTAAAASAAVVPFPSSAVRRFVSTVRGAQLFFGVPAVARLPHGGSDGNLGQLEIEGGIPAMWRGRTALGFRAGPIAARLSRTPTVTEAPTTGASPDSSQSAHATGSTNKTRQEAVVYTVDASVCVPMANVLQSRRDRTNRGEGPREGKDAPSPWAQPLAVTVGLQHPFSPTLPVAGDTLIGLEVQNDRGTSEAYQAHALDNVDEREKEGRGQQRFPAPKEHTFRALVVQTMMSASSAVANGGEGLSLFGGSSSRNTSHTQHSGGSGSNASTAGRRWYSLPTLVGCNLSLQQQLVRLSMASIFHDGEVDVEAAAVVDITPLTPKTPTLLKLGWNNTGRLAFGVTSLFYNALSLTLGVHASPGEGTRFGLEVKI